MSIVTIRKEMYCSYVFVLNICLLKNKRIYYVCTLFIFKIVYLFSLLNTSFKTLCCLKFFVITTLFIVF